MSNHRKRSWGALFTLTLTATLVALIAALSACEPGGAQTAAAQAGVSVARKPSFVFVLTDDLDAESMRHFPKLKRLMTDEGTSFRNNFVNVSLCCPSRSTILRGQFAHNTEVRTNKWPSGGFRKFQDRNLEDSTVATWLQKAGYRTALFAKYLNGYPFEDEQDYVPPGWTEWFGSVGGDPYKQFDYDVLEAGEVVHYGSAPEDYGVDVISRQATDLIGRAAATEPLFLYLGVYSPHGPSTAAPRYDDRFPDEKVPRTASFDEVDVSTKPEWVRGRPRLTAAKIENLDSKYRKRLRSMLAVEDLVENLIAKLRATGRLDDTYIVFTSDNGFHLGQHRLLAGKQTAYEEDIRLPLIVRGPGVPKGRVLDHFVGNVDFAPTFAELAGVTAPAFVDGRSFAPLLGATPPDPATWRGAALVEHTQQSADSAIDAADSRPKTANTLEPDDEMDVVIDAATGIPTFEAIRTHEYKYVEYVTGEKELYDLAADPLELDNLADGADPGLLDSLATKLADLRDCTGASCRSNDGAP